MINYQSIPLHWVNRLGFLTRKELAQRFRRDGYDVTSEEWAVLLLLWSKGAQTPGAIADATFRDRTTVTRLIDGMVRKGFVERGLDPQDRRRSRLETSALGKALEKKLVPIARKLIDEAMAGIDPQDIQTTVRSLKLMTENLLQQQNTSSRQDPKGKT